MIQLYHTTAWTCCWRWAAKDEYVPNQVQPLVQSPARGERFGPRLCTAGTCQVWGCLPPPGFRRSRMSFRASGHRCRPRSRGPREAQCGERRGRSGVRLEGERAPGHAVQDDPHHREQGDAEDLVAARSQAVGEERADVERIE